MKPDESINVPREIRGYIDTDYTGDNYTRKIVTAYIVLIHISVIAWRSRSQKTVKISVTEAEY